MFKRLLVASAVCTMAAAAVAAPAQAGSTTAVTLSAPSSGTADVATAIKGTVRPASTGRRVYLQEYNATSRKWVTRESGTTSRTGAYADTLTTSAGVKTIRLYVPKSGARPAGTSASKKIVFVAQAVSLSMSASQVEVNTQPTATITVSPKAVRSINIQRDTSGGWTTVARIKTDANTGKAVYYPPTSVAGAYSYRAAATEQSPLKALVSVARSITVITPVQIVQVTAGERHTCGLGSDTKTYCWGGGYSGQFGNGDTSGQSTILVPVATPAGVSFTQLTAGESHTWALGSDTKTYCWGWAYYGQVGNGDMVYQSTAPVPVATPAGVNLTQLTAGGQHTCGLGSDTKAYCWGRGEYGRLGNGDTADQPAPVPVSAPDGVNFTQLTAGGLHTCALGSDTKTYCWGRGEYGQLGDGGTANQPSPVAVLTADDRPAPHPTPAPAPSPEPVPDDPSPVPPSPTRRPHLTRHRHLPRPCHRPNP